MSINNYKEKALSHLERRMGGTWDFLEDHDYTAQNLIHYDHDIIILREVLGNNRREWKYFSNWLDAFQFLYFFTRSTKRKWLDKVATSELLWDTDLEIYEQDLIKDIQEIYDYKYSSLDINELGEIIGDLTDEMQQKAITDLIYSMEYFYKKDTIEIE